MAVWPLVGRTTSRCPGIAVSTCAGGRRNLIASRGCTTFKPLVPCNSSGVPLVPCNPLVYHLCPAILWCTACALQSSGVLTCALQTSCWCTPNLCPGNPLVYRRHSGSQRVPGPPQQCPRGVGSDPYSGTTHVSTPLLQSHLSKRAFSCTPGHGYLRITPGNKQACAISRKTCPFLTCEHPPPLWSTQYWQQRPNTPLFREAPLYSRSTCLCTLSLEWHPSARGWARHSL